MSGPLYFTFVSRITSWFRSTRQILSVSCGPWLCVKQVPCGHLLWPFSHGNRACSFSSCWKAEMFFSSLYIFIVFCPKRNRRAKVVPFFLICKLHLFFCLKFCLFVSLHYFCNAKRFLLIIEQTDFYDSLSRH